MESLSDRLKSLGVQVGTANLPPVEQRAQSRPAGYSIEQVVDGTLLSTAFGETYLIEQLYPCDHVQGHTPLSMAIDLGVLVQWGQAPHLANLELQKFVFLDTETSGLAGGTGTFAFLVGLGYHTARGFCLQQFFLREPGEETALLAAIGRALSDFGAVVTFNGKSFDIPLLTSRHILHGFTPPFKEFAHLDLLPLARRLWRNRLPSRALGDLEVEILGMERDLNEVPGWMIPQMYFDYLHSGDARPLAGVLYHNAMDIVSLAALFNHMANLLNNPLADRIPDSLDLIAIARLYEDIGKTENAVSLYEFSLQQGLPEPFLLDTLMRFADLYRRRGEWPQTLRLWQTAASYQHLPAYIELAKYYEHRQRDYSQALHWVEDARLTVERSGMGLVARQTYSLELEHRRQRLIAKQARKTC